MSSISVQLSFIIPAYNASAHIDQCLQSIFQQDLARGSFEVILVNDGSTDNSVEIAQCWSAQWPELKIISQPNKGVSATRNLGIEHATGTYIWFVDVDDYIFENCAQPLLNTAIENDLDVLTFQVLHVPAGTLPNTTFEPALATESVFDGHTYIAMYNYSNGACMYMVRTELLRQRCLEFIEGRLCEDSMFIIALLTHAHRVAHYPSQAYVYVKHMSSITNNRSPEHSIKMCNDFTFVIGFIDDYIREQSSNTQTTPAYFARLASRRDSFTLFLCIRLLRSTLNSTDILSRYRYLRKNGWIPLKHLSSIEYPGIKYSILKLAINSKVLYYFATHISRIASKY